MATVGLAALLAIPGILVKAPAVPRLVPRPRPLQAVLHSASVRKRSVRFRHRQRVAAAPACVPRLVLFHAQAPWPFPGAWINSGPFAEVLKTARWFSTGSTVPTARTGQSYRMPRSLGMT